MAQVRQTVSKTELDQVPYLVWNSFIDLLATTDYDDFTPVQRVAQLAFWYDSEVQSGGHLQYFENQGSERSRETIDALLALGGRRQAEVLEMAARKWLRTARAPIRSVEDYLNAALDDEFGELDTRFHECLPDVMTLLHEYLEEHEDEFIAYGP